MPIPRAWRTGSISRAIAFSSCSAARSSDRSASPRPSMVFVGDPMGDPEPLDRLRASDPRLPPGPGFGDDAQPCGEVLGRRTERIGDSDVHPPTDLGTSGRSRPTRSSLSGLPSPVSFGAGRRRKPLIGWSRISERSGRRRRSRSLSAASTASASASSPPTNSSLCHGRSRFRSGGGSHPHGAMRRRSWLRPTHPTDCRRS